MLPPGQGLYLYCFSFAAASFDLPEFGIDQESPVIMETFGPVAAILSPVSLDVFLGPDAETRLEDTSWVTPRAVRHEQVIETVMQAAPVFPARFGTIFSSPMKLQELIQQNSKQIVSFLEDVQDKDEFSLKGYLDISALKKRIGEDSVQEEAQKLELLPPGKRYFEEKKIRQNTDTALSTVLSGVLNDLKQFIASEADQSRDRSLLSKKATGKDIDMIFNAACLVLKKEHLVFQQLCKAFPKNYNRQDLELEVSGPWPPYSFCPPLMTAPNNASSSR